MKKRLIKVTSEDIKDAIKDDSRSNPFMCPIARAVRRKFNTENVSCGSINMKIGRKQCHTPDSASVFMEKFDLRKRVKPFSFYIKGI